MKIRDMYLNGEYLKNNPTWDKEDAQWKTGLLFQMIKKHNLAPKTVCEKGCGSGEILYQLEKRVPGPVHFTGYEIAPEAFELCQKRKSESIHFMLGNFTDVNTTYDIILLKNLIENLEDCIHFLRTIKPRSTYKILHVRLDVFAISTLCQQFLIGLWKKGGHLHFFSKNLVLMMLKDTGYKVIDDTYTSGFTLPMESRIKDIILRISRRLFFPLTPDFIMNTFGGTRCWSL